MRTCPSLKRRKSLIILELDINETRTIGLRIVDALPFLYFDNGRIRKLALVREHRRTGTDDYPPR